MMNKISFLYGKLEVLALTICKRDNKAFGDMIGDGMEVILKMKSSYDASKGVDLWDYVKRHVEKAMWKQFNRQNRREPLSFDVHIGNEDGDVITLADTLADPMTLPEYEAVLEAQDWEDSAKRQIRKVKNHILSRQEKMVVKLYCYGWDTRKVADYMCLSESRIRQIRRKALDKMKMEVVLL